jgi:hypothetical protein
MVDGTAVCCGVVAEETEDKVVDAEVVELTNDTVDEIPEFATETELLVKLLAVVLLA